jgi:hypothetical protein
MKIRQAKKIYYKLPADRRTPTPYKQATINKALRKLHLFYVYYGGTKGKGCHKG